MKKFISAVEMFSIDNAGLYLAGLQYYWSDWTFSTDEEFDHDKFNRRYLLRVKIYEL